VSDVTAFFANRQPVTRAARSTRLLRVTVFAPDDLTLVKGGPAERREFLDELLAMLARGTTRRPIRLRTSAEAGADRVAFGGA